MKILGQPHRGCMIAGTAKMSAAGGVVGGMETFTLVPRGPFSLAASIKFLEGFTPAAYRGSADDVLELAFPVEGSWQTAGVRVRQDAGDVTAEIVSPAEPGPDLMTAVRSQVERILSLDVGGSGLPAVRGVLPAEICGRGEPGPALMTAVRSQVERILSLDVDGSGFPAVGERDPVAWEIQRRYPGLRPVGFWSPYEAAAWTIIGHRIRITQAAAIKARMAEQLGEPVSFGDRVVHAFPAPQRLAGLDTFPGLAGRKPEWLRSL